MLMGGARNEHIRRANAELEDLLTQTGVTSLPGLAGDRFTVKHVEEAQRPLVGVLSSRGSGALGVDEERLLATEEWQPSVNSSHRAEEPSLLGSGWSWQHPKDFKEGAESYSTSSLNNTADSETLRRKLSGSSLKAAHPSDETARWQNSALMTSRVGSDPIAEGTQSDSSRFSTSASESGDDWSASDDEAGTQQGLDSIPLDTIIGRGAFGSVYRTTWKGQPAAIKVIEHEDELLRSDDEVGSEDELDSLEQRGAGGGGNPHGPASTSLTATQADQALLEAAMSSAVHHPNVVQTYHYRTVQPSKLASGDAISRAVRETQIVMEFCDCGSLEDAASDGRLADENGADVDLELLCRTLLEVARAMEYLHKMHITHRDLKLANVLLKSAPNDPRGFCAKVSDFGLSRLLPDHSPKFGSNPEYTGTITHMAPELLEHGGMSRAADVYSYGILMWEALMGEPAYQGISKMQVMFGVVSEGLRPTFPPNTPPWYAQIATACWRKDPRRRPTFTKVCQKLELQLAELRAALSRR